MVFSIRKCILILPKRYALVEKLVFVIHKSMEMSVTAVTPVTELKNAERISPCQG